MASNLRAIIDRLCSLPGFGPGREDLVLLQELLTLQNGEQQLQALGRAMATFAGAIQALKPGSAIVAALCRPS